TLTILHSRGSLNWLKETFKNRGKIQPRQPPTDYLKALLTRREYEIAQQRLKGSLIGSAYTVKPNPESFITEYADIDELMVISYIYDQDKQIDSYRRLERAVKSY
ncbi:hypothetical protein ACEE94_12045, partial [Staphylococcus epidermidis]